MFHIYLTSQSGQGFANPASAGTPERLTTVQYTHAAKQVTIKGIKSSRTNNAGTVYVGTTATNDDQQFDVAPGVERTFEAPKGQLIDPYDIFIDIVTAGDGAWWYAGNKINA